ncbi:MAG: amidohydrolase family protein, partial [Candidatus Poribacteria bacterium]|nr:amidohydrolase family protein [Candidatus Poribacteria bacterium]
VLLIDNKPYEFLRGRLGALGGAGSDPKELEALLTPGLRTYADGCHPASYDPQARLNLHKEEGIDIAMLYPTIGIIWEGFVNDPKLASAYTRAYNRWLLDFCSVDFNRLIPIAHVSLLDPQGAVNEIKWAKENGFKGIFVSPDLMARSGLAFNDPLLAPFWGILQDTGLPLAFHVVVREKPTLFEWHEGNEGLGLFSFTFLGIDVMAAFTSMCSLGIFEKYPKVKCLILEAGSNWISAWLDRMDHKFIPTQSRTPLTMKPSECFYRQCLISADPDESLTSEVIQHMGDDYFVWASDFPHIDADFGTAKEIAEHISPLPLESQKKVLGENALNFYGLNSDLN